MEMSNPNTCLERLRQLYKPSKITLLLVGESPPPHKGFFFDTTVSEGQLSRNTRKAFQDHYETEYADRDEFLAQFKAKHCFLVDLFQQRGKTIHKAGNNEKQVAMRKLAATLRNDHPRLVASVLKRIQKPVQKAIGETGIPFNYRALYYPTRQYIPQYRAGLLAILADL